MKTIRLLYPDYVSGGLETYYFGANLLQYILPENKNQPLIKVSVTPPNGEEKAVKNGIFAESEVLAGIIWIDAHPDVSTTKGSYPNAHAMVLGSLLGAGAKQLSQQMKNAKFKSDEILYVGLQPLHDYQEEFLNQVGVKYKVQDGAFVSDEEIKTFMSRFKSIMVHFDIDVLDEHFFHSTYFANPELAGDGSGGGRMTMEKMSQLLKMITAESEVVGFTIAEYLPFDEHRLHKMFAEISLFTD
ncbi:MAG: arginase family protein [Lachnospiraceae bacterium]|jgi:arginase|nr:arginase family protein [Lachnospiraceae bacterium]